MQHFLFIGETEASKLWCCHNKGISVRTHRRNYIVRKQPLADCSKSSSSRMELVYRKWGTGSRQLWSLTLLNGTYCAITIKCSLKTFFRHLTQLLLFYWIRTFNTAIVFLLNTDVCHSKNYSLTILTLGHHFFWLSVARITVRISRAE